MTNTQLYRRLLRWVIRYWKIFSIALFGMTIMALAISILPILTKQIVDSIFIRNNQELLQQTLLTIILLFVARGIASYISSYSLNIIASKLEVDLRTALLDKLLALSPQDFRKLTPDILTTRFIKDINQITSTLINATTILAKDSLTIIGLIICMFYLNWELTFLILLIVPILMLIAQLMYDNLSITSQKLVKISDAFTQSLLNTAKHYKTIKLYGGEAQTIKQIMHKAKRIQNAKMHQAMIRSLMLPLVQFLIILMLSAFTYLVFQQVNHNTITLGIAGSIIIAAILLILPLRRITNVHKIQHKWRESISNIFLLLDQEKEEVAIGKKNIHRVSGRLVFKDVCYYNDTQSEPILDNINMVIKPRETVAIIGSSACERATFIDLMLRFSLPTTGNIYLDDFNLKDLKLSQLRANFAIISEDENLLGDRVATNIAYGTMRCMSEAKITAAAQASQAAEFIKEMPEGFQTRVGENGIKLTRIQCFFLAIARALLRNPPILILNGIPSATEVECDRFLNALAVLTQNRTTLIFTEHLPQWKKIDRILVLENRRIVGLGKRYKLLTKFENYSKHLHAHFRR